MYTFQIGDLFLEPGRLVVGLQTLNLQLSGVLVMFLFLALGAYIGWLRGIRAILTIALVSVIAYLICVRGGDTLVGVVNRFYQNGPKLFAFAAGRDPGAVNALDPLIEADFSIPLFFRFMLFLILIAFAWFFNTRPKWYSAQPNLKVEPLSQVLGAALGGFTSLLWISAFTSFWADWTNSGGGFGGPIADVLNVLPDMTVFIPSLIAIFFLLLIVIVLFNLPKLWKA